MNKLKAKSKGAWKRARETEAKARGQGGFPPNLKNLVAACQSYKLAETKKGDPFFTLTCIVKDPEEFIGRRATFMWFINESEYATVEDNLENLANDLKLLGMEMPEDLDDLPAVFEELCERGVHLLFNTGGPRKNGGSPNLFVQDLAGDDWPDEPQETEEKNDEPSNDDSDTSSEETEDNNAGEDAGGDDTTEAAAEEEWIPAKGEQYNYTPPKGKKALLVEVVAVNKKAQSFDLKTVKTKPPQTFKGVKWHDKEGNPNVEAAD